MHSVERNIEDYAQKYLSDASMQFEGVMVEMRRKKVLEVLNQHRPKTVLEIGCGTKSLFDFYTHFQQFVVVEPSLDFFKMVQQSPFYQPEKIVLINDFLENQLEHLKSYSFDCIVLSSLLHEVLQPLAFLKELHSLCTPKTLVHVNVPNNQSLHLLWAVEAGLLPQMGALTPTAQKMQQFQTFNLESLKNILLEAGFNPIEGGSYFLKPFNHSKMQRLWEEEFITSELLNALYTLARHFPQNGAEIYYNATIV